MEPFEIIMAPFEVWLGPVGESWPDVDTTPGGNWIKLGVNGKRNTADGGVTVNHSQAIKEHSNEGTTGPLKAVRTGEGLDIEFTLEDLTLEAYSKAMNGNVVSITAAAAGTPGYRSIPLHMGPNVSTYALLCKGVSAYNDGYSAQYQVPKVYQSDSPKPAFSKSKATGLKLKFTALEDPDAASDDLRFGKLVMQDATAL
jgi:hypothetical protein